MSLLLHQSTRRAALPHHQWGPATQARRGRCVATVAAAPKDGAAAAAAAAAAATAAATPSSSSSSSSSSKGFAATTTAAAPKKNKPRSNGRGALKRTAQGARLAAAAPATPTPSGPGEWVPLAKLNEWRQGKAGKAVTLPDGTVLCLFAVRGGGGGGKAGAAGKPVSVYATEIYSSAFKYPLVDAEVDVSSGSPIVTVPFDGTTYNLVDGSVVAWCPRNTPVRALLGAVKSRVEPTPIRVYPARVSGDGQGVEVWFAR